jgi:hypothetical protein
MFLILFRARNAIGKRAGNVETGREVDGPSNSEGRIEKLFLGVYYDTSSILCSFLRTE